MNLAMHVLFCKEDLSQENGKLPSFLQSLPEGEHHGWGLVWGKAVVTEMFTWALYHHLDITRSWQIAILLLSWVVMTVKSSDINVMSHPVIYFQSVILCHVMTSHYSGMLSWQFTSITFRVVSHPVTSCHDSFVRLVSYPVSFHNLSWLITSVALWISCHTLPWVIITFDVQGIVEYHVISCHELSKVQSVMVYLVMSCHDTS